MLDRSIIDPSNKWNPIKSNQVSPKSGFKKKGTCVKAINSNRSIQGCKYEKERSKLLSIEMKNSEKSNCISSNMWSPLKKIRASSKYLARKHVCKAANAKEKFESR